MKVPVPMFPASKAGLVAAIVAVALIGFVVYQSTKPQPAQQQR